MCERWRESFEAFMADMGACPPKHSLDRIDVDGPYSPENCRWASNQEQANNTTANRILEHRGERHTVAEWARIVGLKGDTLKRRILLGWPIDRALTAPLR